MIQACKRLQHSIQLQALISGLNTKGNNYLIAKTVISSNDSCFVTRLSVVGHASSQDSPMWDILRHRNVRCGTYTVTRLSDVGHVPSQDCPMWAMFRHKTVRCGPCSVTRLSDVGHVPSQDCPMWGHVPSQDCPMWGHVPSQDCPMWDMFRQRTVRCGTCSVTRLSDVDHVPSQDCPMWAMFRHKTVRCGPCSATGSALPWTCPSQTHDSLFAH